MGEEGGEPERRPSARQIALSQSLRRLRTAKSVPISAAFFVGFIALHFEVVGPSLPVTHVIGVTLTALVSYLAVGVMYSLALVQINRARYGRAVCDMAFNEIARSVWHVLPNEGRRLVRLMTRFLWCVAYLAEVQYMTRDSPDDVWDVSVPEWFTYLNAAMGVVISVDLCVGFAAAPRKALYVISAEFVTDLLLSPPAVLLLSAIVREGSFVRLWARFGYARMLGLLDTRAYAPVLHGRNDVTVLAVQTLVKLTGITLFFAGFFWEAEAPDHAVHFDAYSDFLYFMFITMSTTGYGDWAPTQKLTRWVAMGCILLVMTTVPSTLSELAQLLSSPKRRMGLLPPQGAPRFVMVGDIVPHQLDLLLRDLYGRFSATHSEAGGGAFRAGHKPRALVLTSRALEEYDTAAYVRKYGGRVCLMRGDVLSNELSLIDRLGLNAAIAVFVVASSEQAGLAQRQADQRATLTALALAKFSRKTVPRMLVQLNRDEHAKTLQALGVQYIIAQSVLKMQLLGKCAAGCNGLSTVISALFLLDDDSDVDEATLKGGEAWGEEYARSWQWELYTTMVPDALAGEPFGVCALAIYELFKGEVLVLGVANSARRWLGLNPSIREVAAGEELVVLADGPDALEQLKRRPPDRSAIARARMRLGLEVRPASRRQSSIDAPASASASASASANGGGANGGAAAGGGGGATATASSSAAPSGSPISSAGSEPPRPMLSHGHKWTNETILFGGEGARNLLSAAAPEGHVGGGSRRPSWRVEPSVPEAEAARASAEAASALVHRPLAPLALVGEEAPSSTLSWVRSSSRSAAANYAASLDGTDGEGEGALRPLEEVVMHDVRSFAVAEQLILVCGWPGNLGVLLETASHLCSHTLVVLAPAEPDDDGESMAELRLTARTHFVRGSALDETDLARAGLGYASCAVLFGGEDLAKRDPNSEPPGDAHAVLAIAKIRNFLNTPELNARRERPCQLLTELDDLKNVRFVDDGREWWPSVDSFTTFLQSPAIASGSAYADEMACTMVTANFYMPLLIAILKNLVGDAHTPGIEQLPVPQLYGEISFGELFTRMVTEGYLVIGLYCPMDEQPPSLPASPGRGQAYWQKVQREKERKDKDRAKQLRTVIAAITTLIPRETGVTEDRPALSYVFINPPAARLVRQSDRIFVLTRDARSRAEQLASFREPDLPARATGADTAARETASSVAGTWLRTRSRSCHATSAPVSHKASVRVMPQRELAAGASGDAGGGDDGGGPSSMGSWQPLPAIDSRARGAPHGHEPAAASAARGAGPAAHAGQARAAGGAAVRPPFPRQQSAGAVPVRVRRDPGATSADLDVPPCRGRTGEEALRALGASGSCPSIHLESPACSAASRGRPYRLAPVNSPAPGQGTSPGVGESPGSGASSMSGRMRHARNSDRS